MEYTLFRDTSRCMDMLESDLEAMVGNIHSEVTISLVSRIRFFSRSVAEGMAQCFPPQI